MSNVLDEEKPLQDSIIWELQKSYYDNVNIKCWSDGIVPNFVTSNCFIAHQYARGILTFIRSYYASRDADKSQPIYILELGAGHGKLTFHIVKFLLSMKEFFPPGVDHPFKCILTDFSSHFVDFWRNHPPLAELAKDGWLDYAVFDSENDTQLDLELSHTVIKPNDLHNPLVVVANYLFDSLKQAAMRFSKDNVEIVNCKVLSDRADIPPTYPDIINHMTCEWSYDNCTIDYFNDEKLKNVLKQYTQFENSTVLIPIGSINTMKNIKILSNNKYLMLVGDKAYITLAEISNLGSPFISLHGSFSFVVNLHCIMEYIKQSDNNNNNNDNDGDGGGSCLVTPYTDGIKCCSFYQGIDKKIMNQFCYFWKTQMEVFGPETFSRLQRSIREETNSPSLKNALSVIRLSYFDSDVFYKFRQVLIDRIPYVNERQMEDILKDLKEIYNNYYPLQRIKDITFELGRIYMGIKQYKTALNYFEDSKKYCGEHPISWYNMGICYFNLNEFQQSYDCFNRSLNLRPDYHDARSWKTRVESKLASESKASEENKTEPV